MNDTRVHSTFLIHWQSAIAGVHEIEAAGKEWDRRQQQLFGHFHLKPAPRIIIYRLPKKAFVFASPSFYPFSFII